MTESSSNFTFEKRKFLLTKLDEIIKLWARGYGQGSFYFTVNDGDPNLQFGLHVDLEDDPAPGPEHHLHKRVCGPAQQAKNRERAIAHQARLRAAAAVAPRPVAVTAASRPTADTAATTLPRSAAATAAQQSSAQKVAPSTTASPAAPSSTAPAAMPRIAVASVSTSSLAATAASSTRPITFLPTVTSLSPSFPGLGRPLAVVDSYCSWCRNSFDGRSSPVCCSSCKKFYHKKCHGSHSCDPPD